MMGHLMSSETKNKISQKLKNRKFSQDTLIKMSESQKGKILSIDHKHKISLTQRKLGNKPPSRLGKKATEETKRKMSEVRKGMKHSEETRRKLSESHKGSKNYLWKGGISKESKIIRSGIEYRLWRESVFARDNWTCQNCKNRGNKLQAHHIKSFTIYPEFRFAINNGITLCINCHKLFHKNARNHVSSLPKM